jgi:hypothetical protein
MSRPSHRISPHPHASFHSPLGTPGRRPRAAFGAASFTLLLVGACGEDPPAPELGADAGPVCERGTRNCACIGGSGCRDDLLCIAGLCSARLPGDPPTTTPRPRPAPPRPSPIDPEPDAGDVVVDAGSDDAGISDASVTGAVSTSPDAG